MDMNESETRSKLVDPKLKDSGWDEYLIRREVILCPGKIIDDSGTRKKSKRTDYILSYNGISIAVIESKDETHIQEDGLQQSKTYAKMLNIPFAYSTNGHGIEEFDFFTSRQSSLTNFPSPEQLWERYVCSLSVKVRAGLDALKISPYTVYKVPRYYQEAATKKCIEAFLEGENRILRLRPRSRK
jgi:type I restriction enzyme, R subunit